MHEKRRNGQRAGRMKIGMVFDDSLDKPDGVQQFVLTLGQWLAVQGHDVHYLSGETRRTDIPNLHSLSRNVSVRFNQNRMAIPLPARRGPIRDLLKREQFDILHVQVPYSPALAARIIAAADPRTAVVGTFHVAPHSNLVAVGNRLLGRYVRKTLRRFDAMTATSAPAREFARATFRIDSEVVPLPVDITRFYSAEPFARYAHTSNVVFLGRLVERKGCRYLLDAVARLHADGIWPETARVIVCGKGPLESALRTLTARHGIDGLVEFVGYISEEDKPRYLAGADIAVYPSTGGESFGIVLLEAMAAARGAVLAGNNPGYTSVMAPRPESLFDPHDTALLADTLVSLLVDRKARADAHNWQREYVRQFAVPAVGAQFLDVYDRALQSRRQ